MISFGLALDEILSLEWYDICSMMNYHDDRTWNMILDVANLGFSMLLED